MRKNTSNCNRRKCTTKRIKAACIYQTILFSQKEEHLEHDYVVKLIQDEVNRYKETLNRNRTKYKIVSEETQEDGSVMIKIIKQYNMTPVGDYLN